MACGKQLAREIFQSTLAALDIPRVIEQKLTFDGQALVLERGRVVLP